MPNKNKSIAFGVAGIVGPVLFVTSIFVQGLINPSYSHVSLPISALAAWPTGWIQNLTFVVFGLLFVIFAIGLHLGIRSSRFGMLGPALLSLGGIGLVVCGIFPWVRVDGQLKEPVGHIVGAITTFASVGTGLIVLSRRMLLDADWRGAAAYAFWGGVLIVALFLTFAFLASFEEAPFASLGRAPSTGDRRSVVRLYDLALDTTNALITPP